MLKTTLTHFLVCPSCEGELICKILTEASDLPWREVMDGRLICQGCQTIYPINRGIPRLLPFNQL